MGKLMRVTLGSAFLVAVDIRRARRPGKMVGVEASAENRRQVWAPAGFARGFCVLSEFAEIQYKCTGLYNNKANPEFFGMIRRSESNGRSRDASFPKKTRRRRRWRSGLPRRNPTIFSY